ncbi:hypothetical protein Tco_1389096, partial [Tanacetum coccineum]
MAPLLHRNLRHLWLRYQVEGYDKGIVHSYEKGLEMIWGRVVNRPGGARRKMTWRQFILALGLHTKKEMAEARFGAYWSGPAPFYVFIRDLVRRLCHRMIAYSISGRGQAPENVTGVDLFYLRNIDRGTANANAAGVPGAAEDSPAADEDAQAVPAPVQAPQPPPPAPQHRTMLQRIERIKEDMSELRQSFVGLRGVVESSITEQTRVSA